MTISLIDLALYASALFFLFITPGPVWLAVVARSVSGGFKSAWPLALGVALGDVLWPLLVILGLSAIVASNGDFLIYLRYVGGLILVIMGIGIIRYADKVLASDNALTRPGMWAGFIAGLVAVTANPKASVFYIALLPGFFDIATVTWVDIIVICVLSFCVPLIGNLAVASFVDRIRRFLKSKTAVRRTNIIAGLMIILVGCAIPFI